MYRKTSSKKLARENETRVAYRHSLAGATNRNRLSLFLGTGNHNRPSFAYRQSLAGPIGPPWNEKQSPIVWVFPSSSARATTLAPLSHGNQSPIASRSQTQPIAYTQLTSAFERTLSNVIVLRIEFGLSQWLFTIEGSLGHRVPLCLRAPLPRA